MNMHILKSFISRLEFVSKKVNSYYSNFDIDIKNQSEKQSDITGIININNSKDETELILFESKITKTDDMLIFKTKYQNQGKIYEETDTFAITKDIQYGYTTPKTKLLIHIANGNLFQAYRVGKKYKFENGINENLSKLNMENKYVLNMINQNTENRSNKKR